ncbi:hypothetical protein [Dyadobacter helix]|nr:hypothetical protein [Dyadobacter sp. CECT 9275]
MKKTLIFNRISILNGPLKKIVTDLCTESYFVSSAEAFTESLNDFSFDLILLQVDHTKMDYATPILREAMQKSPLSRLVLFSDCEKEVLTPFLENGAHDFIGKNALLSDFHKVIAQNLNF